MARKLVTIIGYPREDFKNEMKKGHLSEYFTGVAAKRLSAVEVSDIASNQHEYNGTKALKLVFGASPEKQRLSARFLYLDDEGPEPITADAFVTWYDARESHDTRSEHRLYFPTTSVSERAVEGDLLVVGLRSDVSVLVVIAAGGSTAAGQLKWLFGLDNVGDRGFDSRAHLDTAHDRVAFASRFILEQIGVAVAADGDEFLSDILKRFGDEFPSTRVFSAFARESVIISPLDDPDAALMAWMEREEIMFRSLERYIIKERLAAGFGDNVDAFIDFSLSVQNRRKSRVGLALENHLEQIFVASKIHYARGVVTENKARPDFLFPGQAEYRDLACPPDRLTMLGVKSTCKDRWRQVLAEADRIVNKHLLTLETAISTTQTDEMRSKRLQLVVPRSLHSTYTDGQRAILMDVSAFLAFALARQR